MNISDLFTKEVNYIKNEHIKNMVIQTLNAAPEWLQVIPASSSGKYHPEYADRNLRNRYNRINLYLRRDWK